VVEDLEELDRSNRISSEEGDGALAVEDNVGESSLAGSDSKESRPREKENCVDHKADFGEDIQDSIDIDTEIDHMTEGTDIEEEEGERVPDLRESVHNLEDAVGSLQSTTGAEPTVQLRYRSEGAAASSISLQEPETLPGPSRVVTGPGTVAFDPVTGARRRRSGVSSAPTSTILNDQVEERRGSKSVTPQASFDTVDTDSDSDSEMTYRRRRGRRRVNLPRLRQKLTGHRNARTMIKEAAWWGKDFILSGSDCGHLFAWDRKSGECVTMLEADRHVVNCVQPHPTLPLIATSGIDYDVKLWSPIGEQPQFDSEKAEVVMRRNEVMLEETRDTITVPASLMIRMLASLNQIRRGQNNPGQEERESEDE